MANYNTVKVRNVLKWNEVLQNITIEQHFLWMQNFIDLYLIILKNVICLSVA